MQRVALFAAVARLAATPNAPVAGRTTGSGDTPAEAPRTRVGAPRAEEARFLPPLDFPASKPAKRKRPRRLDVRATHLAYGASSDHLYVAVGADSPQYANSLLDVFQLCV
jgi:hypothetical protein